MSNTLSPELVAQLFAQESDDPFLTLVTLSHPSFASDIRLVNNSENITSRSLVYQAFPMRIRFPVDDGESVRDFTIDFDNVSLELIEEIRTVFDPIDVKIEMVLASMPDDVQISQEELKIGAVTYNQSTLSAKILMDNFLNVEMTSERYNPQSYRGIF